MNIFFFNIFFLFYNLQFLDPRIFLITKDIYSKMKCWVDEQKCFKKLNLKK